MAWLVKGGPEPAGIVAVVGTLEPLSNSEAADQSRLEEESVQMNEGGYVRHTARPEWGVGRIVSVAGDDIRVQFRTRTVTLKASIAGPHLEELTAAEVAEAALSTPPRSVRRTSPAHPARSVPCITCAEPLKNSQRRLSDTWKSCPG